MLHSFHGVPQRKTHDLKCHRRQEPLITAGSLHARLIYVHLLFHVNVMVRRSLNSQILRPLSLVLFYFL